MGLELSGRATFAPVKGAKQQGTTKVHLDSEEILLRGEVKLRVPRATISDITTRADVVTVTTTLGILKLTLGDGAERFARKLAEAPKSRLEKMGIGAGSEVTIVNLKDAELNAELKAVGATTRARLGANAALIILGVETSADLERIATAAASLAPDGALWVIHPKGTAGVKDTDIFAAGKAAGLTYTKVAKYSATHTAEKLVVPVAMR
jgi:hypothetical protein